MYFMSGCLCGPLSIVVKRSTDQTKISGFSDMNQRNSPIRSKMYILHESIILILRTDKTNQW